MTANAAVDPEKAIPAGFALVVQDVRGTGRSEGEFDPFVDEAADGYDSIEWVAAQEWCNGAVMLSGRSYVGATQWLAAAEQPPSLKAIAPVITGSNYFHGWVYQGGAFQLGFNLFWVNLMNGMRRQESSFTIQALHLPVKEPPLVDEGEAGRFYKRWLEHSTDDDYWRGLSINQRYEQVQVPALNVGGWYDVFLGGTLENYRGCGVAADRRARGCTGTRGTRGRRSPSPCFDGADTVDLDAEQLAFFADPSAGPRVRLFVMGTNVWRDEEDWPLARAVETPWYLRAGRGAVARGAGRGGAGRVRLRPGRARADAGRADVAAGPDAEHELRAGGPARGREARRRARLLLGAAGRATTRSPGR